MSEFFKAAAPKESRVSMFEEWSISQPQMREGKGRGQQKSKPEQVRRAQQLLNDAQQLSSNILGFLRLKGDLIWQMQNEQSKSSALLQQVFALNNSRSKNLEEQESMVARIRQILKELYRSLRMGRALQDYTVNCFQCANLANFDPKVHQLRGGKGAQVAQQQLNARLKMLENSCNNLYRSLHYLDKLDSVFGKEESFHYCYLTLQEQLSHDSQVKIHALMVSQLVQIEQKRVALSATNRSVEAEYRKYQLIYDCLQLMRTEREQMVKEIEILKKDQEQVTRYVPVDGQGLLDNNKLQLDQLNNRQIMQKIVESEAHVESNLKVYRTNLQNFKRVSAQTSLYCYAYRESQFSESLNQLQSYYGGWKKDQSALSFFYAKREELLQFRDHQSIKRTTTDSDRQYVANLYSQVREKKAGPNPNIQLYQQHVLTDIERELKQRNIPFPPRQINPVHIKTVINKQDDFFDALYRTQKREKVVFLRKNRGTINALIFELGQANAQGINNDPVTTKKLYDYSNALAYCKVMASEQSLEQQVQECEGLLMEGRSYKELPKGVTELVLSYVHDANLLIKSQAEREAMRAKSLPSFGQTVQGQVHEKRKGKVDESIEANIFIFNQHWINFYDSYYRLITPYGQELMMDELLNVCLEIGRRVRDGLTSKDIVDINAKNLEIEKGMFYSYRVLLSLVQVAYRSPQQAQKFRVSNLDSLLISMMEHLEHYFIIKPVNAKATDLLKLTLLQIFLSKCYHKSEYPAMVRVLRLQVFLQIVSELYIGHITNVAIADSWIHPLLTIQLRMKTLNYTGQEPKTKVIAEKVNSILPQLRKLPLSISAEHDVSRAPNAIEMKDYLEELHSISAKESMGISEAAIAWQALNLVEDTKIFVKTPFGNYQNAVVSDNRGVSKQFVQVWSSVQNQLKRTGDSQPLARYFADSHSIVPLKDCIVQLLKKSS